LKARREPGFSIRYFAEFGSGATDQEVLAAASDAQSLLLPSLARLSLHRS
jgi:hypothetical protein